MIPLISSAKTNSTEISAHNEQKIDMPGYPAYDLLVCPESGRGETLSAGFATSNTIRDGNIYGLSEIRVQTIPATLPTNGGLKITGLKGGFLKGA
jgi:hypothetical protein